MTTQNKAVTCYLPKDIEDFITGYCNEYGITRKDKEGHIYPSLGTGIIELLKLLAYNPELVGSPLPDTVPSTISEAAIEKKIDEILEKKRSNHLPDNVPSIEVLKDRLDNWVLAVDGDIKDINQKIRDRSLQVDHQIASIKSRLEILEPLLKLQRESSIADHSPIPTGEPSPLPPSLPPDKLGEGGNGDIFPDSPPSPPDRPAIEDLPKVETVETDSSIETVAIEDSEKKIPLPDISIASPIGIDETVSTDSSIKSATDAIETDDREWLTLQQIADKKIKGLPGTHQGLRPYAENWEWRENPTKKGKQYKIPREYLTPISPNPD